MKRSRLRRRRKRAEKPEHYADRYEANQSLALPKPGMRKKDKAALDAARARGRCEWPGCRDGNGVIDPAHIKGRGAGGDDDPRNLVALCRRHHDDHHHGRIQDWQLRLLVAARCLREAAAQKAAPPALRAEAAPAHPDHRAVGTVHP